jgi:hypothetical protein
MNEIDFSRARWQKSSHSGQNGNCLEVARNLPGTVAVRDSKNPDGPALIFTPDEWRAFLSGIRDGQICLEPVARANGEVLMAGW